MFMFVCAFVVSLLLDCFLSANISSFWSLWRTPYSFAVKKAYIGVYYNYKHTYLQCARLRTCRLRCCHMSIVHISWRSLSEFLMTTSRCFVIYATNQ
jgi:hypothetical protein